MNAYLLALATLVDSGSFEAIFGITAAANQRNHGDRNRKGDAALIAAKVPKRMKLEQAGATPEAWSRAPRRARCGARAPSARTSRIRPDPADPLGAPRRSAFAPFTPSFNVCLEKRSRSAPTT